MSEKNLSDALNNCIDRLAQGNTIEECLMDYPEIADDLRSLLETGMTGRLNRADSIELNQMRGRMDARIEQLIAETDFDKSSPFRLPPGITVLVASLILVFAGILLFLPGTPDPDGLQSGTTDTPAITETISVTDSPTATATVNPTETSTDSPTVTNTPAITETISPTETPTNSPTTTPSEATATDCTIPDEWFAYRVKGGDTLSYIAVNSGVSIGDLREANCLSDSSVIIEGQILHVPQLWDTAEDDEDNLPSGNSDDDDEEDDDDHEEDDDDHEDDD